MTSPRSSGAGATITSAEHVSMLQEALHTLTGQIDLLEGWGAALTSVLLDGGRLLAVGNGGSAAQAQHLTSELVGRYREERLPLSAISLHAESSAFTAIANDYGLDEAFARQVRAHGRVGDVLLALSTSGRSPNVLGAVTAARATGLTVWAMTGPGPNRLADLSDAAFVVPSAATATVQEVHQVAIHLLCGAVDAAIHDSLRVDAPTLSLGGGRP
ncbi:MAG: phosphoheptose isomerase [Actinomycetia bacterium]|nr:phosphoheptose isomerase [Actinomycetes bacterium]